MSVNSNSDSSTSENEWGPPKTKLEDWMEETKRELQEAPWETKSTTDSSSKGWNTSWPTDKDNDTDMSDMFSDTSSPSMDSVFLSSEDEDFKHPNQSFDPADFEFLEKPNKDSSHLSTMHTPFVPIYHLPQHTFYFPADQKWFEIITDQPDGWEYSDAETYVPRQHGTKIVQSITRKFYSPPPGHPAWCEVHDRPITKYYTTQVFSGDIDNHPLQKWENEILPIDPNSIEPPNRFYNMTSPFMMAFKILSTQVVHPKDWEGTPNTEYRREVRFKIWMALEAHKQANPFITSYLMGASSHINQYQYMLGTLPPTIPFDYRTKTDCPGNWQDTPFGAPPESDLVERFANPYTDANDSIAFNPWNPHIAELRKARAYILQGIKAITIYFIQPKLRDLIDNYKDDLKHFFYHHCHIFRFLDSQVDPLNQGFTCKCLHYDEKSIDFPPTLRKSYRPRNPLLSEAEDEFLHHASRIFENLGKNELTNAIRQTRAVIPFMAEDVSTLFKAGYLDILSQFDEELGKYPLLWLKKELYL
jgi:hypothetical protein